jgi:hypothetical protein
MPICQGCNVSFDESFAFCPYCGRAKPETPKIKLEVDLTRKQTPEDCPKCNNDTHTQKVSSIYASGTSTGTDYTVGSGTSNYYQTYDGKRIGTSRSSSSSSSFSINQSQLAEYLIPPTPPKREGASNWPLIIIVVLALLFTYGIFDSMKHPPDLSGFGTTLICCGVWALMAALLGILWHYLTRSETRQKEEAFQEKMKKYKKARYVWEHLYYCHKHDIVFLEGRKDYFPVKETLDACYILGNELYIIGISDRK